MGSYRKKQYSIDNGKYSRKVNQKTGKTEGIKKVEIAAGRNGKCLCGSGKKYKRCCLPKGIFFKQKAPIKLKGTMWATIKIRIRRLWG
jgi:hypothetical protein